jgi:hypothetical protein
MAQVVECLPSKCKVQSSKHSATHRKGRKEDTQAALSFVYLFLLYFKIFILKCYFVLLF